MITQLRTHIKNALTEVNSQNAPNVYTAIADEQGYKNIEQRIIEMMARENLTASACIVHIENSL
ncbi:hypothetical protein C8N46_107240 [Kordia periserrulae]|uniref:Uncharacterized protein n=1 Tax=Kordia periserrulae TaxID=701523 RepID=A0A2T6BVZ6_9FLAO|nr:hypothetical protein [Kordia periserrulae]PTX60233.1 hypothetical protein C8N46_107240 [Kordia periserrulae]